MSVCQSCHHMPSEGYSQHGECYCRCHDVADASHELLAACELLDAACVAEPVEPVMREAVRLARAAIAKAKGGA